MMKQWQYWQLCRKVGSLPDAFHDSDNVRGAVVQRDDTLNPFHPDATVFYFRTFCPVLVTDGAELRRYTLWRHSFLRDKSTAFCSFEVPIPSPVGHTVEFYVMGQNLLVHIDKGNSVEILVFKLNGDFVRKIRLKPVPRITNEYTRVRIRFDEDHCHLTLEVPRREILAFKYRIDPLTNYGRLVQRSRTRIPNSCEVSSINNLGNHLGFELSSSRDPNPIPGPWIDYDYKTGFFSLCTEEQLLNGREINWRWNNTVTSSLMDFETDRFVSIYIGYHTATALSPLDTLKELYLLCSKDMVGEEVEEQSSSVQEEDMVGEEEGEEVGEESWRVEEECGKGEEVEEQSWSAEEEEMIGEEEGEEVEEEEESWSVEEEEEKGEKRTSKALDIYSLPMQPQSLKMLALSALLKNFPSVKDLPQKEMRVLGIPENMGKVLEEHRKWESDTCLSLGVL